ncbi:alpha/beta-hydrolase [Epithele typhae]|uniref:alpha/beta-hydrolase n=1 Tax=Epithele typhae TaxID=378194 RepID=UPI00200821CE|nr:alpha/beta-hydrolase [Epithele typhae]KAH9918177.1 alpha/beta-hydrolase [Epithele typhae]
MDAHAYKEVKTKSGHLYNTFVLPPKDSSKATFLFVHGFPSTAYDWRNQIAFFSAAGYGIVAPDLLGHGGSSRPSDLASYVPSKATADLVDILDHLNAQKVIAVGHDWGSILVARLAQYFPGRTVATVFLGGGYCPPMPDFDLQVTLQKQQELAKTEMFAYWLFLGDTRAEAIVNAHLESLLTLWYTANDDLSRSVLTTRGALENWLTSGKKAPLPAFISSQDHAHTLAAWTKAGGLGGALKSFRLMFTDAMAKDDQHRGPRAAPRPVFFAGCARDPVCLAEPSAAIVRALCDAPTVRVFDTGHWVQLEAPEKLNRALLEWAQGLGL